MSIVATEHTNLNSLSKINWLSVVKVFVAIGIIIFLATRIEPSTFAYLRNEPKRWDLLFTALIWVLVAHILTYVRWWQLVKSLGVDFPIGTAIRVGFLGTAFNLISVGAIGGDIFKAVIAARSDRKKMPEILTSVILDRVVGLMGLIIVTSVSLEIYLRFLHNGADVDISNDISILRQVCLIASVTSVVGMFTLAFIGKHLPTDWLSRIPWIGSIANRMASSLHLLYGRPGLLLSQLLVSCFVHVALVLGFYSVSIALYSQSPGFIEHLVAIPPAFAVAALPISPGGVGVFELAVLEFIKTFFGMTDLYASVLVVILAIYRFLMLLTAAIGGLYYLFGYGRLARAEANMASQLAQ